ncbi:MAG TPA: PH domain-containing protein [Candidatus Nanoarchaeia archaeon]|nr:PH domain-containing protein [Candidatus Nanoarchaeia archaeon]
MADETIKYAPLGGKTLFILIFKRGPIIFIPLILLAAIIFSLSFIPVIYSAYAEMAAVILAAFSLIIIGLVLLIGWLEYSRYKIFIDQQSIKINRGIIKEEQIGIPFRRIKEAAIERGMFDQLFGISNLILTVLGEDDGKNFSQESRLALPALDRKIAQAIQDIILKRADVEEMNIETK